MEQNRVQKWSTFVRLDVSDLSGKAIQEWTVFATNDAKQWTIHMQKKRNYNSYLTPYKYT